VTKLGAIIAASAVLVGLAAVPASASVRPQVSQLICLNASPNSCLVTNGENKDVDVSTARQTEFTANFADVCDFADPSWQVSLTYGCPFVGGSDLNNLFNGDIIVTLNADGDCLTASTTLSYAFMGPCEGGPYQEWVLAPSNGQPNNWVSVGLSDHEYTEEGVGPGQPYGLGTNCTGDGCEASADHNLNDGGAFVTWSN
jgi:hypothetical protein